MTRELSISAFYAPRTRVLSEDRDGSLYCDGEPVTCPVVSSGLAAMTKDGKKDLVTAICCSRCAWMQFTRSDLDDWLEVSCGACVGMIGLIGAPRPEAW